MIQDFIGEKATSISGIFFLGEKNSKLKSGDLDIS